MAAPASGLRAGVATTLEAAPGLIGLTMLAVAGALYSGVCAACASALPAWAVAAGGVGWIAIDVLRRRRRLRVATLLAVLGSTTHAVIVLRGWQDACWICLALLGAEIGATLILVSRTRPSAPPSSFYAAASAAVALSAMAAVALVDVVWSVPPDVLVHGSAVGSDTVGYIVVRRECADCKAAERKLVDSLDARLLGRAMIALVDERSATGRRLRLAHALTTFPSFVALRRGEVLFVLRGGSVMDFTKRLEESLGATP